MKNEVDIFVYEEPQGSNRFVVRPAVAYLDDEGKIGFHAIGKDVQITLLPNDWEDDDEGTPIALPLVVVANTKKKVKVKKKLFVDFITYKVKVEVAPGVSIEAAAASDPIIIIHPPTN